MHLIGALEIMTLLLVKAGNAGTHLCFHLAVQGLGAQLNGPVMVRQAVWRQENNFQLSFIHS